MFDCVFRGPSRRVLGQGDGPQGGRGGRGSGTKPGSEPGGECVCPSCGQKLLRQAGQRCLDVFCPKFDTRMVRK